MLLTKRFDIEPKRITTEIFHSGNEYAKRMTIPKGWEVNTHKHTFDHISILASGVVVVICEGESAVYKGDSCIVIKKDIPHKIVAMEDSVWYCIHATTEWNLELIDETLINE